MTEIKELNRKCEMAQDGGIACGPCGLTAVNAEMEIEEDGQKRFLIVSWIDEVIDSVSFEVTKESIYPFLACEDDDLEKLEHIRSEADEMNKGKDIYKIYSKQYDVLVQMVKDKIIEEELIDPDEYESGEIEWDF